MRNAFIAGLFTGIIVGICAATIHVPGWKWYHPLVCVASILAIWTASEVARRRAA